MVALRHGRFGRHKFRLCGDFVTDRTALVLAIVILAAFGLDGVINGGAATMFLLRKCVDMVEYVAFWR